jgi:membrane-associated protein
VKVRQLRILRSPRGQAAIDRAERALTERGAAFIIAARYIPVGRVAVNMTAGAVGFPRRRFVGLAAIAAVTWSVYAAVIGIGAGAWLGDHMLVAVAAGVVGGIGLGVVIDQVLRRLTHTPTDTHPDEPEREPSAVAELVTMPPVTGRSRSDRAA